MKNTDVRGFCAKTDAVILGYCPRDKINKGEFTRLIEYEFLRILNDFVRVYKDFPLPAVICDMAWEVYWSNPLAKSMVPNLTNTQGLQNFLGEFDRDILLKRLNDEGNCRINGAFAFSGIQVYLSPMMQNDEMVGVIMLLTTPQTLLEPQDLAVAVKTPAFLQEVLRKNVEDMFAAMDLTVFKADMMNISWIKPSLNGIVQSGYQILRVADNIANYTAFLSQPPELHLQPVPLFGLLRDFEATICAIADSMGISARFLLPEEDAFVNVDLKKFETAFFNIVHNALYFSRSGSKIEILGEQNDREVVLTVSNHGAVIAQNRMSEIFKPYYSYGMDGVPAGAGLGLPIAKTIFEAHGGTVAVASDEKSGTRVAMRLPKGTFSRPLHLAQSAIGFETANRFSAVYIGLVDAARSPFLDAEAPPQPPPDSSPNPGS